jgi:hypothetical protein
MRGQRRHSRLVLFLFLTLAASRLWAQGPPYQTDDPVPVDLHHYEFYIFGSTDGTPAETDSTGPAFEFNWGAIPRVQLHMKESSFCFATATLLLDRRKTTPTSACTGHGEKTRRIRTRPMLGYQRRCTRQDINEPFQAIFPEQTTRKEGRKETKRIHSSSIRNGFKSL